MDVVFPGGARVDVLFGDFRICTDQSARSGGEGRAPTPFDLFLASLAACAGYYARRFCDERGLSTDGLGVSLGWDRDAQAGRLSKIRIAVVLPEEFPAKYREAIRRSVDLCAVKRHVVDAPEFELTVSEPGPSRRSLSGSAPRSPETPATASNS